MRLWIIWFCINCMYMGQLMIIPFILNEGSKSFGSYFVTILGEAPTIILSMLMVDHKNLGRKNTLSIFFFSAGCFHLLCYFFKLDHIAIFSSIARFCMKISFAMLYPISKEFYPSQLGSMGYAYCSGVGRLGAAAIPFLMFALI